MDDLGVPPFLETNLLLKIAIEIVELPIKNCDFHSYVNVYQRVFQVVEG